MCLQEAKKARLEAEPFDPEQPFTLQQRQPWASKELVVGRGGGGGGRARACVLVPACLAAACAARLHACRGCALALPCTSRYVRCTLLATPPLSPESNGHAQHPRTPPRQATEVTAPQHPELHPSCTPQAPRPPTPFRVHLPFPHAPHSPLLAQPFALPLTPPLPPAPPPPTIPCPQVNELTEEQKEVLAQRAAGKEEEAAEAVEAKGPTSFFHGKEQKDYQGR